MDNVVDVGADRQDGAIDVLRSFRAACLDEAIFVHPMKLGEDSVAKWPFSLEGLENVPSYDMLDLLSPKGGVGLSEEMKLHLFNEYQNGLLKINFPHERFAIVYLDFDEPHIMLAE